MTAQLGARSLAALLDSYVRCGILNVIEPTTTAGWTDYDDGRGFLPALTNYCANPRFVTDSDSDGKADGVSGTAPAGTPTWDLASAGKVSGNAQRYRYTGVAGDSAATIVIDVMALSAAGSFAQSDPYSGALYYKLTSSGLTTKQACIQAYDSGGSAISGSSVATDLSEATEWTRASVSKSAALAGTSRVQAYIVLTGVDEGDTIDLEFCNAVVTKTAYVSPYFSGDQNGVAWTGTADASTSTATGSQLIFSTEQLGAITDLTVAMRCQPCFAGNDSATGRLLYAQSGASFRAMLYKTSSNTWAAEMRDGVDTPSSQSGALTFAAYTEHVLVARFHWSASDGKIGLNSDGTNTAGTAATAIDPAHGIDRIVFSPSYLSALYMGPVLVSPTWKSDAWVDSIQANSGAAYDSIAGLLSDYMAQGDVLFPLDGDPLGYHKVAADPTVSVSLSPYASKGANTYKGAIHFHTTASDGDTAMAATVTALRDAGYDFVVPGDHDVVTADPSVASVLYVSGVEETCTGLSAPVSHVVTLPAATANGAPAIQTVISAGDFVSLAHPLAADPTYGLGITAAEALTLTDYDAVEVYNGLLGLDSSSIWQAVIDAGRHVWGIAAIDTHVLANLPTPLVATVVYADALTESAIVAALKAGQFYSTRGPLLTTITDDGRYLSLSCADACNWTFLGPGGRTLASVPATKSALYAYHPSDVHVRVLATRVSDNRQAWTNPIFIS